MLYRLFVTDRASTIHNYITIWVWNGLAGVLYKRDVRKLIIGPNA